MKAFASLVVVSACTSSVDDGAGTGGGKADQFGLNEAQAAAVIDLVNYATPQVLMQANVPAAVANAIVAYRAGADGMFRTFDDDNYVSIDELADVTGVNGAVVAKLRSYATAQSIVALEQVIRPALHTGAIPLSIDRTEAAAIVQAPAASVAIDALAAFYINTPAIWTGDPWLGDAPRVTPLLDPFADEIILEHLKSHGRSASDLLLRKLIAEPPKELPTPDRSDITHARAVTAVWNGASYPTHVDVDPFGEWTAHYYTNDFTTGTVEYLQFSRGSFNVDLKGQNLASGELVHGTSSGDPSLSVSSGGWSGSAVRVKWRVLELVLDPATNKVERAVITWNRVEDLRFGMEPGFLVYNARDPEGSWTYPTLPVDQGSSDLYGPYKLAPGTRFSASITGTGNADLIVRGAGETVLCTSAQPATAETCQITATSEPVRVDIRGMQAGNNAYTLTVSGTPAPR